MPLAFLLYIKVIDKITDVIGRITMYTVFAMMGILVLSFVTRNIINFPLLWIIEMAQFIMTGYYLMGGAYSMKEHQHVRMDLVYGNFSEKNKARMDLFTSIFLIFYLVVLLIRLIQQSRLYLRNKKNTFLCLETLCVADQ
jgi:TRAP-type mannitol/chloroaromatic compound transport system permease small subunit